MFQYHGQNTGKNHVHNELYVFFPYCGSCPKPSHFMVPQFIYLNSFYKIPSIVEATTYFTYYNSFT